MDKAGVEEAKVKDITCVPGEFVLRGPDDGTPLHIYGRAGVGRHLEVGHVAQRSWGEEETSGGHFRFCKYSVIDTILISWDY